MLSAFLFDEKWNGIPYTKRLTHPNEHISEETNKRSLMKLNEKFKRIIINAKSTWLIVSNSAIVQYS